MYISKITIRPFGEVYGLTTPQTYIAEARARFDVLHLRLATIEACLPLTFESRVIRVDIRKITAQKVRALQYPKRCREIRAELEAAIGSLRKMNQLIAREPLYNFLIAERRLAALEKGIEAVKVRDAKPRGRAAHRAKAASQAERQPTFDDDLAEEDIVYDGLESAPAVVDPNKIEDL